MSDESPSSRVVVVTGGSRGIGRAICETFAANGYRVYFNFVTGDEAAAETENRIKAAGGQGTGIRADVSQEKAVQEFFGRILEESGHVNVLVNNAGITRDGLLLRMKARDWDQVMEINLRGVFHCTKSAAKSMLKQRAGKIINITSVIGVTGNAGQANYAASKAGIIGFTKSIAKELASRSITVNAVAPGYIETEMTEAIAEKARDVMLQQIPLGRVGSTEDVAETVLFLASEKAAYITGQVIHVSGGLYI